MEERDSAQRRIGSPADGQAVAQPVCLADSRHLPGRMSEMDLISVCRSGLSFSSTVFVAEGYYPVTSYRGKASHGGLIGVVDHSADLCLRLREIL